MPTSTLRSLAPGSLALVLLALAACEGPPATSSIDPVHWERRTVRGALPDSLGAGATYLPVYSEIYSKTEDLTHRLTVTVSIRNVGRADTVYLRSAEYFDTHGAPIRTYFTDPVYLAPLETIEIVINEVDEEGGTGGNFLFDWAVARGSNPPLFEAVMISTSAQQGLSFTTHGVAVQ